MKTKEKIIVTALNLFNQEGTDRVSTNHIADAAGISPENLYYHFSNKEEIIRAICERLFATWDEVFALPDDRPPTLEDVQKLVRLNFEVSWEDAFVYREILALLRNDPILHERYLAVRERGYTGFRHLIDAFAAAGVLQPDLDVDSVTKLTDLCWLISESWLTALELQDQPANDEQMQRGIDLVLFVLRPI